ncbi:hypothetical protein FHG87_022352 [Trinorchestia longiramus]|nr:hypothetical protein FHG87_022352 [Trinorchestia longiramus]
MDEQDNSPSVDDIEAWVKAPWIIKFLIVQLESWMPSFLVTRNRELKACQPFLHAILVIVLIAVVFGASFYKLHQYLFRHLAGYYPLLKVVFQSKPSTPHPSVSKLRGRTHRPSSTSYRGSKFSSARSMETSSTPPPPSSTPAPPSSTPAPPPASSL